MQLEHSITIPAPQDVAWAVTVDVERWPEWTPTMQSVERLERGPFGVGSTAKIKQPQLPPATPVKELLHVAFSRWRVERCFEDQKTEWGFDHFEGRS